MAPTWDIMSVIETIWPKFQKLSKKHPTFCHCGKYLESWCGFKHWENGSVMQSWDYIRIKTIHVVVPEDPLMSGFLTACRWSKTFAWPELMMSSIIGRWPTQQHLPVKAHPISGVCVLDVYLFKYYPWRSGKNLEWLSCSVLSAWKCSLCNGLGLSIRFLESLMPSCWPYTYPIHLPHAVFQ